LQGDPLIGLVAAEPIHAANTCNPIKTSKSSEKSKAVQANPRASYRDEFYITSPNDSFAIIPDRTQLKTISEVVRATSAKNTYKASKHCCEF